VCDDSIAYTQKEDGIPLTQSADFLHIASTLLLIKSKSLLPGLVLSCEEEQEVSDLQGRLKVYQTYKHIAEQLKEQQSTKRSFFRYEGAQESSNEHVRFSPSSQITKETVHQALQKIFDRIPHVSELPQATVQQVIRLDDVMQRLVSRVQKAMNTTLKDFATSLSQQGTRSSLIVSFLAVLELAKRDVVDIHQPGYFRDISISARHIGTPEY